MRPFEYQENEIESKVGEHVLKIYERLQYMETFKQYKPNFSEPCERLVQRIKQLKETGKPKKKSVNKSLKQGDSSLEGPVMPSNLPS